MFWALSKSTQRCDLVELDIALVYLLNIFPFFISWDLLFFAPFALLLKFIWFLSFLYLGCLYSWATLSPTVSPCLFSSLFSMYSFWLGGGESHQISIGVVKSHHASAAWFRPSWISGCWINDKWNVIVLRTYHVPQKLVDPRFSSDKPLPPPSTGCASLNEAYNRDLFRSHFQLDQIL